MLVCALIWSAAGARAQQVRPIWTFPIRFHARPSAEVDEWMRWQVDLANRRFGDAGLQFVVQHRYWLDAEYEQIGSVTELATMVCLNVQPAAGIDVFLVSSVEDPNDPAYGTAVERGLSLRPGQNPDVPGFVLVTRVDFPVLAHELGHYFALVHTAEGTSLMSRRHVVDVPFSLAEIQVLRTSAAADAWRRMPPVVFDSGAPWPTSTGWLDPPKPALALRDKRRSAFDHDLPTAP